MKLFKHFQINWYQQVGPFIKRQTSGASSDNEWYNGNKVERKENVNIKRLKTLTTFGLNQELN